MSDDKIKVPKVDTDQTHISNSGDKKSPLGIPSNLKMDDKEWGEYTYLLETYIDAVYEDSSKSEFDARLAKYEKAILGQFDSSRSKPWSSSSEIVNSISATHCKIVADAITRTLTVEPFILAKVKGNKESQKRLQDFMNDAARNQFRYEDMIRNLSPIAVSTPGAVICVDWLKTLIRHQDYEVFESVKGFKAKYPDAESSGLTESEYEAEINKVKEIIDEKGYYECNYEYDAVDENRPNITVIHPSRFLMYPFNASRIDLAKLIGHEVEMTFDEIVRNESWGVFRKGTAEAIKTAYVNTASNGETNPAKLVQEEAKGILEGHAIEDYKTKIFKIVKGCIRCDYEKDGIERDYEFFYITDEDILARFAQARYHYKKRNYFITPIENSSLTVWGECIPSMIENEQEALSTLMRQLIDSNSICNVPSFYGNSTEKDWLERSHQSLTFHPGKLFWLKNPGSFGQIQMKQMDALAYLKIMQFVASEAEMHDGASRTLAGQPLAEDPEAPGVKTQALMQQANFRVNSYIEHISSKFPDIFKFIVKLYRQYLHLSEYEFNRLDDSGNQYLDKITRDDLAFLDDVASFEVRPQTVDDNQQLRVTNARQDLDLLMSVPQINQNPLSVRTLLRNYMLTREAYTLEEITEILTPVEEIIQGVMGATQDLQQAEQLGQHQQQVASDVQNQADQQDQQILQAMQQEGQGIPSQGIPGQ